MIIEIKQEVEIKVGGTPLDEFIKLVSDFAHDLLLEESIARQNLGFSESEFYASTCNAHKILNLLNE